MQVIGWGRMVWIIGTVAWLGCTPVEAERPIAAEASTAGDIPQSAWPEAWFRPPATAAMVGLQTFRQSPELDELVAAGELPPVAKIPPNLAPVPPSEATA